MDSRSEGSYTLLDVRQPTEYETAHLPGARLIPLPRLADSLSELDSNKPTIVYCAVGMRSLTAAQLLSHQGFTEVYNIVGGIEAWEELPAQGPVGFHAGFIGGDESPEEMLKLAYRMEHGLQRFHQAVRDETTDPEISQLLSNLIRAEESHKKRLRKLCAQWVSPQAAETLDEITTDSSLMEGGFDISEFMDRNRPILETLTGVLSIAMMIETQALDLYLQMADESADELSKELLFQIAEEEKQHLGALGRVMEEKTSAS
jgi:rhodanese-related sulfurtransferase/rubrerythrin